MEPPKQTPRFSLRRALPLLLICAGVVAFFALGGADYLTLESLKQNRQTLAEQAAALGLWAYLIFIVIYALATAFSVPGGAVLTLVGGFLFGWFWGGLSVVVAATLGAVAIFLAAKTALGDALRARAGPKLQKIEEGFQKDAASYMLFLRLVPLFPFFLVNLAPAFLGVPLRTYAWTTFVGIIPGTFVYASVGAGLGAVLDAGEDINLGIIFEPEILLPIVALALLSLVPAIVKRFRKS